MKKYIQSLIASQSYAEATLPVYAENVEKLIYERNQATELIESIMRGEVNPEDECEKYLREYNPQSLT